MELIAYELTPELGQRLMPASGRRDWLETPATRFGRRCLPIMMANRAGWDIVLSEPVKATWTGGDDPGAVSASGCGLGAFGSGILTFRVAWLFRTPPGWNLLVRGPVNAPKDGICPLEGIVETDWANQTFTMNWQFTRPGTVVFGVEEPFCTILPQRRGELESVSPRIASIAEDPDSARGVYRFTKQRSSFLANRASDEWEGDYLRGEQVGEAERFPDHQRLVRLKPFEVPEVSPDRTEAK